METPDFGVMGHLSTDVLLQHPGLTRTVIEYATTALVMTDSEGRCIYMNPAAEVATGFQFEEIKGRSMHDVLHYLRPDRSPYPREECPIVQAIQTKEYLKEQEETLVRKDKTLFPVKYSVTPILEEERVVAAVYEFRDITPEKKTFEELTETERRFDEVLNDASLMFAVWDRYAHLIFISKPWLEYTGVAQEYALKTGFLEHFHPESREAVIHEWRNAFVRKQRFSGEYQIRRADGEYRWFYMVTTPRYTGEGRFAGFYATAFDIHERKQIELALSTSETRFKRLYESSLLGVMFWHLEGPILQANDVFLNMLGYNREEFEAEGLDWRKLTPEEYARQDEDGVEQILNRSMKPIEKQFFHRSGRRVDVLIYGTLLEEKPSQGVAFVLDITVRKNLERTLQESEAKFRQLSESGLLGLLFCTTEGTIYDANETACQMIGYTREEIAAKQVNWDQITPLEFLEEDFLHTRLLLEGNACKPYEKQLINKDGSRRDVLVGYTLLPGSMEKMACFMVDITERKNMERALHENEENFRLLANQSPVLMWIADEQGKANFVNKTFTDFTGLTLEQICNETWIKTFQPDDAIRVQQVFDDAYAQKKSFDFEGRVRYKKPGQYRWTITTGIPRFHSDGAFAGYMGTVVDIDERKEAELALQRSEEYFRQIADASSISLWLVDENSNIIFVSQGLADFLGQSKEELMGLQWQKSIHPDHRQPYLEAFAEAFSRKSPFLLETQVRTKDGMFRWVLVSGQPRYGYTGRFAGFSGTLTDISHQKEAEFAQRKTEEYFQEIMEAAPVNLWMSDAIGSITFVNRSARNYFQVLPGEFLGEQWLAKIHPDDREWVMAEFQRHIIKREDYTMEFRAIPQKDGQELWLLSSGQPRYLQSGEFAGYIGTVVDITTRKETEIELRKSQEYFQYIVDTSPVMLWMSAADGQNEFVSERLADFFGLPKEEFEGLGWLDFFHPNDRETLIEQYQLAYKKQSTYVVEVRARSKSGEYRWVANAGQPRFDENKQFIGIIGTLTDIHDRKEAEMELRKSQEYFRYIVDTSPVLLWMADANGNNEFVSEGLAHYFGRTKEEMMGMNWLEAFHPDDRGMLKAKYLHALQNQQTYMVEIRALTKTGEYRWVLDAGQPRFDEHGRFIGLIGTITDIQDRKEAEMELRKSQEYFQYIVDTSPVMLWMCGTDGNNEFVSEGLCQYFGLSKPEMMGMNWMQVIHPEDLNILEDRYFQALHDHKTFTAEVRAFTKNGEYRWILDVGQSRFDEQGRFIGFIGTITDIQDRKEAMLAIEKSEEYFRYIVDFAPVMLWMSEPDGQLSFVSKELMEYFELPSEQLKGKGWLNTLHPDNAEDFYRYYMEHIKKREPYQKEIRLCKQNERRWALAFGQPRYGQNGEFLGFIGTITDITEKRKAEIAIQESEAKFRMIVDAAPVKLWMTDTQDNFIYTNKGLMDFIGHQLPESLKVSTLLKEIAYPDDLKLYLEKREQYIGKRDSYEMELRIKNAKGDYRWVLVATQPRYTPEGQFVGYTGSLVDITEKKEAEIALQESEAYFRMITDVAPVMLWTTDENGSLAYVSRRMLDFLGDRLTIKDMDDQTKWGQVFHPDDVEGFSKHFRENLAQKTPYQYEARIRNAQDEYRWIIISARPRFSENGHFDGYVGSLIDITKRKQSELALQESEARFRVMADAAPVNIWISNRSGQVEYFNKQLLNFLQISQEDARRGQYMDYVHPEDRQMLLEQTQQTLRSPQPFHTEVRMYSPGFHGYRWFYNNAVPRFTPDGSFLGYVGSSVDITDYKQAQSEVQNYAKRLEQSNLELEQFATIASHDLQAPLRKISMFSSYIQEHAYDVLPEESKNYFERILSSVDKMQHLLTDLLDLSRVNRRGQPFRPVELNTIVDEVLCDLQFSLLDTQGRVDVENLCAVDADPLQMHQLFQNLIGNALKFHKPDVPPVIKIYTENSGNFYCCIVVEDNGIGFIKEHSEQIFEPFVRLHSMEHYEGSGMGLAICKKIVERHGGSITASSEPDIGTRFVIMLPREHPGKI